MLVGMLDPSIPYMSGDDSLQAAGAAAAAVVTVARMRRNSIELVISAGEVNIVASRGLEARSEAAGTLWSHQLSRNNMANSQVSASECLRVPLIANSQVITCIGAITPLAATPSDGL